MTTRLNGRHQTAVTPNFIKTSAETTSSYIQYAEYIKKHPGLTFGCDMDKKVIPLKPGDVVSFVSRPGNGKTALMSYMAKRTAAQIIREGKAPQSDGKGNFLSGEVVLYVSWEQVLEEIEANIQAGQDYSVSDIAWGRADMETVKRRAYDRVNYPVWLVGQSVFDANKRQEPMTFDALYENIRRLKEDFNVTPRLICLDYLQIIPVPGSRSRQEEVSEAIVKTKGLAIDVAAPILIGVQAKAGTDNTSNKIPQLGDAYYTSEVAHVVDKNFGLMKPIKYYERGRRMTLGEGREYEVDDNLFIVEMTKQRMENGSWKWALYFDMARMVLGDYDRMGLEY